MKAHIIENEIIINTIEVNSLSDLPDLVDGSVGGIGWAYINGLPIAPTVLPKTETELAEEVRSKRDSLITATDYYALTDVTMNAAVTTYRQALRDVPTQAGFPYTITWPTAP